MWRWEGERGGSGGGGSGKRGGKWKGGWLACLKLLCDGDLSGTAAYSLWKV